MKLIKMIVNDYRQFDKAELDFDDDVTIIAGANNQCHLDKVFYDENSISYAVMH